MISLDEVAVTPEEAMRKAERMRVLGQSAAFQELLADTRNLCAQEWAAASTADAREAAWQHLQGIRAMEKQLQVSANQGARAAMVLRGQ